jgi:hypothetical protein
MPYATPSNRIVNSVVTNKSPHAKEARTAVAKHEGFVQRRPSLREARQQAGSSG